MERQMRRTAIVCAITSFACAVAGAAVGAEPVQDRVPGTESNFSGFTKGGGPKGSSGGAVAKDGIPNVNSLGGELSTVAQGAAGFLAPSQ